MNLNFTFFLAILLLDSPDLVHGAEDPKKFIPFPYQEAGINNDDLHGKLALISGSKLGSKIIQSAHFVSFVKLGNRVFGSPAFSYSFDERSVISFLPIEEKEAKKFIDSISDPDNFDILDKVNEDAHPFRGGETEYALEISNGTSFSRLYFSEDGSSCYFVNPNGFRGKYLIMSPSLKQLSGKISAKYKLKLSSSNK